MRGSVDSLSRAAVGLKTLDQGISKTNSGLMKMVKAGGAAALIVGGGLAVASQGGLDFEHTLASLAAVAKPTSAELEKISATALQTGSDFGFSAIDVAAGMEAMSKQGLTTVEVIKGISGVAGAAAADGSTLDETMGGLLSTMSGLGAGAGDLQHIADVMAKAGDATAASIGSLSQSMAVFGPTARALGIPLESAIGQLAILQDAGIDASSAGTTLSAVYSKLAAPTGMTVKALKKLELSVADSFGNMKPPAQLMSEIFKATSSIEGNVGKAAAITELVGLESQKALLNIAASVGSGKFDTVMKSLTEGVDGYSASIAKAKQNSGTGDIAKFTAELQAMQIVLYGIVSKDLREMVQGMRAWVVANKDVIATGITQFIADFKANLPTIIIWLERVGIAIGIWLALGAAIKIVRGALWLLNAAAWAATVATEALAFANGTLTVTEGTSTASLVIGTGVRWARNVANWAVQASTWAANAAVTANTFANNTNVTALIAGTAARWARNVATWAVTASTWAYTTATTASLAPLVAMTAGAWASVPALWAAAAPFLPLAAAIASLVGVIYTLNEAWSSLMATLGGGDNALATLGKMWDMGTLDVFAANDAVMNENATSAADRKMTSPADRTARSIEEHRSTSVGELTVKAPPGTVEVSKPMTGGWRMDLANSGGY